ncbi:glycosyltransferase [Leifsonia aquatica]|uniref:glycosyltransferase n=1 Tax=Leifsonia aquatica TaxID=144185 RepID=UPI000E1FF4AC|nr:glycosyltransferase [Leifsonia aquatica]
MVPTTPTPADAPRLLVVAPDVVGRRMAGPGLRYVAIARALAPHMPVTLAVGVEGSSHLELDLPGVAVAPYRNRQELELLVAAHDAVFAQLFDTNVARAAVRRNVRLIFDLYNALPVETVGSEVISGFRDLPSKDREFTELLKYFRFVSQAGTYFVASNERQRDYWMGYIMASGGLMPSTFGSRALDDIIGLVPFGTEEADPVQRSHGLRGSHGIADDDFVVLWAGGIWDWFDAETPIRAIAELAEQDPRYKLVFYGTVHPNSVIGRPPSVERAMAVAAQLGALGRSVIFLDEWVPADEWADYLLDADIAISAHRDSLETHYAFRTRILDHFWAGLPSVVSAGDWFADYIAHESLGTVTHIGDVEATKDAIRAYATDDELRSATVERIRTIREDWRWSRTTAPLRTILLGDLMERPLPALERVDADVAHPAEHLPGRGIRSTRAWRFAGRVRRRILG